MKSGLRLLLLLVTVSLSSCGEAEYPPVSVEAAKGIQSGTALADLKVKLGEPHPPTSTQASALAETIAKMPAKLQANAANDESLAWGDNRRFVVVKVNQEGIAWVVSWREGS